MSWGLTTSQIKAANSASAMRIPVGRETPDTDPCTQAPVSWRNNDYTSKWIRGARGGYGGASGHLSEMVVLFAAGLVKLLDLAAYRTVDDNFLQPSLAAQLSFGGAFPAKRKRVNYQFELRTRRRVSGVARRVRTST